MSAGLMNQAPTDIDETVEVRFIEPWLVNIWRPEDLRYLILKNT